MKSLLIRVSAGFLAMASVVFIAPAASANIIYTTPVGATDAAGEPISLSADFTINNGSVDIILTNLEGNLTSAGQLLTGISFNLSGATGSGALTTVNSGLISTILQGGGYGAGVADALTRWKASEGATITLSLFSGGPPTRGIIGPDSLGNCNNPGAGGLYSNANASIITHNPNVLCTASFDITIPGVTTSSIINNVVFLFGTGPATVAGVPPGNCPSCGVNNFPVPEPITLSLFGAGLVGAAALRRRRKKWVLI
jgi:hypothetical protein